MVKTFHSVPDLIQSDSSFFLGHVHVCIHLLGHALYNSSFRFIFHSGFVLLFKSTNIQIMKPNSCTKILINELDTPTREMAVWHVSFHGQFGKTWQRNWHELCYFHCQHIPAWPCFHSALWHFTLQERNWRWKWFDMYKRKLNLTSPPANHTHQLWFHLIVSTSRDLIASLSYTII